MVYKIEIQINGIYIPFLEKIHYVCYPKTASIVLMKSVCFFLFSCTLFGALGQQKKSFIDSNYIYELPFKPGKKVVVMQGYNGKYSHKGDFALDFRVKKGTPIYASRDGIVNKTIDTNRRGGPQKKFLKQGNHIIIKHADDTYAAYWHLLYSGIKVKTGDTIHKGQLIGLSGNTGYSSWPHLHFDVYYYLKGKQITTPTLFETTRGIKQLKVYHSYRNPKKPHKNQNKNNLPKNIDKIEYHFQDASVAPEYHRSYTWIVTPEKIQYLLDSYGTIIKDTTIEISNFKWEQCKTAFLNCGIKNQKPTEAMPGCTGGTGVTIRTWLNGKENFSASKYNCGGKTEGNLAGDTDKFLLNIELGIDPDIFRD